jgi:hypothetical protein
MMAIVIMMIVMAIALNIKETRLMEAFMDEIYKELSYIEDRMKDWHISWSEVERLLIRKQMLLMYLEKLN